MPSDKSWKQKLSSFFKKAAFATAVTVSLSGGGMRPSPAPESSAPLSDNEIALVHGIFGNEVNTAIVRKNFYAERHDLTPGDNKETIASVNDRKNIKFYGKEYHSSDYSRDDMINFGTFVHEITHIWQRQKIPGIELLFMSCHDYDYALDANSRFDDFCIEQQGALMEDYALRFLHYSHASFRIQNTPENDRLLQKVVEERFPEARKTRLAYEAQELQKAAAKQQKPKI